MNKNAVAAGAASLIAFFSAAPAMAASPSALAASSALTTPAAPGHAVTGAQVISASHLLRLPGQPKLHRGLHMAVPFQDAPWD